MPARPKPGRAITTEALSHFHRALSRAKTADEAFCAMDEAMASLLPIRGLLQVERTEPGGPPRLTVGIPFDGSGPPEPVINHCQSPADADPFTHPRLLDAASDEPVILHGLVTAEMPIPLAESARSAAVVPVFRGGEAAAWIYVFLDPDDTETDGLLDTVLSIANLFDRAVEALIAGERAERAVTLYEQQLDELGRVQRALLTDPLPDIPGLELATDYRPSQHAGGDLYGFTRFAPRLLKDPTGVTNDAHGVMIADVSGHGAAAAAVMAMIITILGGFDDETEPDDMIRLTNRRIAESGLTGVFATACFVLWVPDTGAIGYARCGHNPARVLRAAGGEIERLTGEGILPLGLVEDLDVQSNTDALHPGDTLVLYTDGITEAFGPDGDMFGDDRLDEAIASARGEDPQTVIDSINSAVERFTRGAKADDDRTIVVLRAQQ